jgi:GT2 family glycosyltransferase
VPTKRAVKKAGRSAQSPAREPSRGVRFSQAAWLCDNILLIVGSSPAGSPPVEDASLVQAGQAIALEMRTMIYGRASQFDESDEPWLMVAVGPKSLRWGSASNCVLNAAQSQRGLSGESLLAAILTDVQTLVRESFAPLDPNERHRVIEFVLDATSVAERSRSAPMPAQDFVAISGSDSFPDKDLANRLRLSKGLHLIREILRERLPRCELTQRKAQGLAIEALMAIDETSFYVEGWLCDFESPMIRLTAVSPEGARTELFGALFRYKRPDVQDYFLSAVGNRIELKLGFIAYFTSISPSILSDGWLLEMELQSGAAMEEPAPTVANDAGDIREAILNDLGHDQSLELPLLVDHISPALTSLQRRSSDRVTVTSRTQFGTPPKAPSVSIVVPIYRRADFLEHQLAQFVHDSEIQEADLIYVLDSPELARELTANAHRLFRLYGVAFRLICLSNNVGYSTANNIGASFARGRLLLLLNSDVLPDTPGWLSKMTAFYDSIGRPGAVGAKLVYEDDSLQHAGLYFNRLEGSTVWSNDHHYKGLHRDMPAANVPRKVAAVTAACLLIDVELYREIGGLSGRYVQGDYEDSDLCMRLLAAGRENWYFPGAVLYHLEGQSYPTISRRLNSEYNRWLFNWLWKDVIEEAALRYYGEGLAPNAMQLADTETGSPVEIAPAMVRSGGGPRQTRYRNGSGAKAPRIQN